MSSIVAEMRKRVRAVSCVKCDGGYAAVLEGPLYEPLEVCGNTITLAFIQSQNYGNNLVNIGCGMAVAVIQENDTIVSSLCRAMCGAPGKTREI